MLAKSPEEIKMQEDQRQKTIWAFQEEIIKIYEGQNLNSLAGIKRKFLVNGRQIVDWFFKVVSKGQTKSKDFNFDECFDDLIFCSDEILHFTALLYLYASYMNNPLKEGFLAGDRMVYPNMQNLEAKRFNMYANTLYEKVYNYWDRIGDLIAAYFPDRIDQKKVFFPTAIDAIPEKFHNSENYKWLKEFRENEYKKINEKRKEIVHYITLDTDFKHRHIKNYWDKEKMGKLISERDSLSDYFKNHIKATLDGFEKTVLLIEEITKEELKEIE